MADQDAIIVELQIETDKARQQINTALGEVDKISEGAKKAAANIGNELSAFGRNVSKAFATDEIRKSLNALPDAVKQILQRSGIDINKVNDNVGRQLLQQFGNIEKGVDAIDKSIAAKLESYKKTIQSVSSISAPAVVATSPVAVVASGQGAEVDAMKSKAEQLQSLLVKINNVKANPAALAPLIAQADLLNSEINAAANGVGRFGKATQAAQKPTQKLTTELRSLKSQLDALEDAGQAGSEQFIEMQTRAAQLEDAIGDTRERIRLLASDTFAFDAITDAVQRSVAVFGALQGAQALFGQSNEDVQKVLVKLTAIQAISNGLLEVNKLLTTENAAKVGILTFAKKADAAATTGATIVTTLYTRAMAAMGVTANVSAVAINRVKLALLGLGIGAVVAIIGGLIAAFSDADEATEDLTGSISELNKELSSISSASFDNVAKSIENLAQAELDLKVARGEISALEKERQGVMLEGAKTSEEATDKYIDDTKRAIVALKELAKENKLVATSNFIDENLNADAAIAQIRKFKDEFAQLVEVDKQIQGADFKEGESARAKFVAGASQTLKTIEQLQVNHEQTLTNIKGAADTKVKALNLKSAKEQAEARLKAAQELQQKLFDLEKKRIEAENAAERAKLQYIIDTSVQGSEFKMAATQQLAAFEGKVLLQNLETEKKERLKALKATGAATAADYEVLNKEISAREILIKEQTRQKIRTLDNEYWEQRREQQREFLDKMQTDEIERSRQLAQTRASGAQAARDIILQEDLRAATEGTLKRLNAEKAINDAARDDALMATNEEYQRLRELDLQRQEQGQQLADEEAARYYELGKLREQITKDTLAKNLQLEEDFAKQQEEAVLGAYMAITSAIFDIQKIQSENKIQSLEDERNAALKNEKLTAAERARIEEIYDEKQKAVKRQQAAADKSRAIFEASINGAVAITNALGNPLLVGLTVAMVAAQIATIAAQPLPKFAKGKVGIKGDGTATSDSIPAMLSVGESVINASSTSKLKQELEAANKSPDAFHDLIFEKYIRPQIIADRMVQQKQDGGHELITEQKTILFKTKKLEKGIDNLRQQSKKDTDRTIAAMRLQREQIRNNWN